MGGVLLFLVLSSRPLYLFLFPLHPHGPRPLLAKVPPQVEKDVVDLSGNTRMSSPPVIDVPPSPRQEHHDTHEIHSQSSHHGSEDEPVGNRYSLHNDLLVCTFRACKELVSHLATLTEDEFLGALLNVEVISRAYQTLGQSMVAQEELRKRHEQLNHDYVDLQNCNDAHLLELDHLRSSVRRTEQENEGLNNKLSLIESAHFGCESREKELTDVVKDLEKDRDEWRVTASNQVEQIRALEKDLEPKTYQLESDEERIRVLEGEKRALLAELARLEALAVPVSLCYIAEWLGGINLDVPAPRPMAEVPGSTREQADDTDPWLPPPHHEITEDTPFGTTT
nr:hypothetical protein [Tanacetum cinerariifolium]